MRARVGSCFMPVRRYGAPCSSGRALNAGSETGSDRCPVTDDCLADAIDRGDHEGVWGGLSGPQRRLRRAA